MLKTLFHRRLRKAQAAAATKASALPLSALRARHGPVWSSGDAMSLAQNGYLRNAIGFRCVRLVSEAAAAVPLLLFVDGAQQTAHPLLSLLARPSRAQSGTEWMESLFGHLLVSGDAYIELVMQGSRPAALYALRPDRVRVIPGKDGWPLAYEYRVGVHRRRFESGSDLSPILHLRGFHPTDDHYGTSPLEAAGRAIDIHNAAACWSKALLDNAARPSGAIIYSTGDGGNLTESQYARLSEELEAHHQGAQNAGRPLLLEGGLDWKPMGFSPSDMEFLQTRNAAAREIALALGVPPFLLGLAGDSTYSNYQEANRAFYRQTILPLLAKFCAALSAWLAPCYGGGVCLKADLDSITALANEREARWRRITNADFLTIDEKRALLGFGARKDFGGEKRYSAGGNGRTARPGSLGGASV